jgi:hypothetical protein
MTAPLAQGGRAQAKDLEMALAQALAGSNAVAG